MAYKNLAHLAATLTARRGPLDNWRSDDYYNAARKIMTEEHIFTNLSVRERNYVRLAVHEYNRSYSAAHHLDKGFDSHKLNIRTLIERQLDILGAPQTPSALEIGPSAHEMIDAMRRGLKLSIVDYVSVAEHALDDPSSALMEEDRSALSEIVNGYKKVVLREGVTEGSRFVNDIDSDRRRRLYVLKDVLERKYLPHACGKKGKILQYRADKGQ